MSPNSFSLLSPYLFSEWCPQFRKSPTVFILFIVVSVFRVAHRATALHSDKAVKSFYSRKALAGWKASRRLGKQIRGLSRFLSTSAQRFPISMTVSFSNTQFCIRQRFISVYCQYVFLSGVCATTDVGRTSHREFTLVREVRTIAVSRRPRKTDWCFYSVFVQAHSAPPFAR